MRIEFESPNQPEVIALIAALDAFQGALYPPASRYHLSLAALSAPDVVFAVARDEAGRATGCGGVVLHAAYGEVKRMYVEPACRGIGLARQLLAALEQAALERGCSVLRLETGVHQGRAIAFYQACAYRRCGRFGDYPEDPLSVYMEKRLTTRPPAVSNAVTAASGEC